MPTFSIKRPVPFTADEMFAVVADVENYPEFLPFCTGLVVLKREPDGDGECITARMSVGYKAIAESFTSRVTTRPSQKRIDVAYLDGPFKYLENRWEFVDAAGSARASVIDFYIRYEFKSRMLGLLVGAMFDQAFRSFAEAFEKRAHHVYNAAQTS